MNYARLMFLVCCVAISFGCSKPGEQFLGNWSNEWTNGRMQISVERINDEFLVRSSVIDTGRVIEASTARFENGYLVLGEGKLFKKIALVEQGSALQLLDSPLPLPAFRKMKGQ